MEILKKASLFFSISPHYSEKFAQNPKEKHCPALYPPQMHYYGLANYVISWTNH